MTIVTVTENENNPRKDTQVYQIEEPETTVTLASDDVSLKESDDPLVVFIDDTLEVAEKWRE